MKTVTKTVEVEVEFPDCECEITDRETDIRTDLYRAIHNGDIDKAREVMALMAMVDIDRELVWSAR